MTGSTRLFSTAERPQAHTRQRGGTFVAIHRERISLPSQICGRAAPVATRFGERSEESPLTPSGTRRKWESVLNYARSINAI
jgi:hypothetical protein